MPAWQDLLNQYSEVDQVGLAAAAEAHTELIEEAAFDLDNKGFVRSFDIRELWPFVLKRREELAAEAHYEKPPAPQEPVEAPVEPVAPEPVVEAPTPPPAAKKAPVKPTVKKHPVKRKP